jgi:hypothetical protein
MTTFLQPRTAQAFQAYAASVESDLNQRWSGKVPFLALDQNTAEREKVLLGELWLKPGAQNDPFPIDDGLIHDWIGAVFIPKTNMQKVLDVLQNFDDHQRIYPEVKRSKLIKRSGNDITGSWRLERKQVLTVVLDVKQEVQWQQIAPGRWICRAYAKDIREVEHAGTPEERVLPEGEGRGFLWRLYAYWSLETTGGGVIAECRSLSLSRSIPAALSFIIKPFVRSLPRDTLSGTLEHTRAAVAK